MDALCQPNRTPNPRQLVRLPACTIANLRRAPIYFSFFHLFEQFLWITLEATAKM